jgi:anti-sigma B factor antagonist
MNYSIKTKKEKNYFLLKIMGNLTSSNIHVLAKKLESLNKSKNNTIVIDLGETSYIDSHGLGILVYSCKMMEKNNKSLVLLNPREFVRNIFIGTNLDNILRIIDTVEEL